VLTRKKREYLENKKADRAVSAEVFAQIEGGLKEALEHARGKRADLRTSQIELPAPPRPMRSRQIASLRKQIHCSQRMFAQVLNVSPRTVQAWEQGQREPSEAALRLLDVIRNKETFVAWFNKLEILRAQGTRPPRRSRGA
jgi:putative transcriptional regulator